MYIPLILGATRESRRSEKVARFMFEEMKEFGLETEIIDVRELPPESAFSEKISRAAGLVIVTPEYNHGYPGQLKAALDLLYDEYRRKPIGFCGVSSGKMGGVRAVEQLRLVSIELQMVPIREAIYVSNVQDVFDEQGKILDPSFHERAKKLLGELAWYAKVLQEAKEKG